LLAQLLSAQGAVFRSAIKTVEASAVADGFSVRTGAPTWAKAELAVAMVASAATAMSVMRIIGYPLIRIGRAGGLLGSTPRYRRYNFVQAAPTAAQ
jgi:hypothetical protein